MAARAVSDNDMRRRAGGLAARAHVNGAQVLAEAQCGLGALQVLLGQLEVANLREEGARHRCVSAGSVSGVRESWVSRHHGSVTRCRTSVWGFEREEK